MPLRRRLSLVAGATVAIAFVIVAGVCYTVVRGQLRGQVDGALRAQATAVQHGVVHAFGDPIAGLPPNAGGPAPYAELVAQDGTTQPERGDIALPTDPSIRSVAAGRAGAQLRDIEVRGAHLREIAAAMPVQFSVNGQIEGVAIVLARPLAPTDRVLSHLRLILLLLCAGGVALAAALGRVAARRVLKPLAEVAQTAQHISETEDLSSRIHVHAEDEVGQLAMRFNAMIERLQGSRAALDESVHAQRQLVADASHELRTPVTSLRTNIEVLLAGGELEPADRDRLLSDVVEQTEELSGLVGDLIELARGDLPLSTSEDVRLDRVLEEALARARRNAPGINFEARLAPMVVRGVAERLSRAVGNLLDNAARHSPPGGLVEVVLDADGVRVRDHGRGIAEADLPYIFDRFYRGVNARGRQGSGLGLAIVRQVAEQHGGSVRAQNAPGGGALFVLELPGAAPAELATEAGAGGLRPAELPAPVPGARP